MELNEIVRPDNLVCRSCETTLSDQWNWMSWVANRIIIVFLSILLIASLSFFSVPIIMLLLWIARRSERPRCPKCKSRDCIPIDTPAGRKIVGGHGPVVRKPVDDHDTSD